MRQNSIASRPVIIITSSKIDIINHNPLAGRHHDEDAKYLEGGGNDHLPINIREKYGAD